MKKANGGVRTISAPVLKLKKIQKRLANLLNSVYEPKACVYGFVPKKDFIDNAKQHVGCRYILNVDLKDFFNQIHFGRVRGILKAEPYALSEEAAATIANLACFNQTLPQGAPSSPIITNMVCRPFDNQLMQFAKKNKVKYTRYADDITFSSYRNKFPKGVGVIKDGNVQLGNELEEIFKRNNFVINPNKIFAFLKNEHQEVNGLTVNEFVNIKRKYLRLLRAILHNCETKGVYESAKEYVEKGYCKNIGIIELINSDNNHEKVEKWFKDVLKGKILFIRQVRGDKSFSYLSIALRMNELFKEDIFDTSVLQYATRQIEQNIFIVETDEAQGSGFFLKDYGLITSHHLIEKIKKQGEVIVSRCIGSEKKSFVRLNDSNCICSDKTIDYALYELDSNKEIKYSYNIGNSKDIKMMDHVIIIGFPDYSDNEDTYSIQRHVIIQKSRYFESDIWLVDGRLIHGTSGGIVLNTNSEIIGLVKAGIPKDDETSDFKQGFVAIDTIIQSIELLRKS